MAAHPNPAADLVAKLVSLGPYTVAGASKALIAEGSSGVAVSGQNAFFGPERATSATVPDFAVFALNAPGPQAEEYMNVLDNFHRYQVDVTVRSDPGMWAAGDQLARALSEQLQRATPPTGYVRLERLSALPAYVGEDEDRRHRFRLGLEMWWKG